MIIASWNVNSITVRLPHVLEWLSANRPSVLCLQETKIPDERFPKDAFSHLGYNVIFTGEKSYNGVAILSDTTAGNCAFAFPAEVATASKRFIRAEFGPVHVLNVYIPNGSEVGSEKYAYKLNWIAGLRDYLETHQDPEQMLVICGDYNVAPEDRDVYDPLELKGQILVSDAERAAVQSLKDWGLVDTFRMHNQESGQFSWWDYRMAAFRRNLGLRIDHMWVTKSLAAKCTRAWIDKAPRKLEKPSDHAPIAAEFDV